MTTIGDGMMHMDWATLREQKEYCWNEEMNNKDAEEIYSGIIHLIDWIQDSAVTEGYATKKQVFGEDE